jgi:hypothetical protein
MNDDALVTRNDEMMSAPVDREIVFLNQSTDSYVALDEVGRQIWDLLERPRRVGELIDALCSEFDGPREKITADVAAFLGELDDEGIVRIDDGGAG